MVIEVTVAVHLYAFRLFHDNTALGGVCVIDDRPFGCDDE